MDTVACYGIEDKLIDCTYHTDTNEDKHVNDIWINCAATKHIIDSPTVTSKAAADTSEQITIQHPLLDWL